MLALATRVDDWETILAREVGPEELPMIPRPHRPGGMRPDGTRAKFESELDGQALERPPPPPRPPALGGPPGRRRPGDRDEQTRLAQDYLRHGEMTGQEREAWTLYCAGVSERRIAARVGRSQLWVRNHLLLPIREKAGMAPAPHSQHRRANRYTPRPKNKATGG